MSLAPATASHVRHFPVIGIAKWHPIDPKFEIFANANFVFFSKYLGGRVNAELTEIGSLRFHC